MNKPIRVQRKRTKGWTKPAGAVNCTRPSKFSNPFKVILKAKEGYYVVTKLTDGTYGLTGKIKGYYGPYMAKGAAIIGAIDCFKIICLSLDSFVEDIKKELKDKDLMCYCPVDRPCHCDLLLEIANS